MAILEGSVARATNGGLGSGVAVTETPSEITESATTKSVIPSGSNHAPLMMAPSVNLKVNKPAFWKTSMVTSTFEVKHCGLCLARSSGVSAHVSVMCDLPGRWRTLVANREGGGEQRGERGGRAKE